MDYNKEFIKKIKNIGYGKYNIYNLFSDFLECAAISIHNRFSFDQSLENVYMKHVEKYGKENMITFYELLGLTTMGLNNIDCDFLGSIYMELEISSKYSGQFFTPYSICNLMAKLSVDDNCENAIKENGYFTLQEPAVGSGALVLATAQAMLEKGLNPQKQLHATVTDLDKKLFYMVYIQLSLYGIPAIVYNGNTLSNEMYHCWKTPFHITGNWDYKLKINQGN